MNMNLHFYINKHKMNKYIPVILPVVSYSHGQESWSLTPTEESALRVFENMVLRRIMGHNGNKTLGQKIAR
jgi:hypothetical protein